MHDEEYSCEHVNLLMTSKSIDSLTIQYENQVAGRILGAREGQF